MTSSLPTPAAGRGWGRAGGRLPFLAVGIGVFLADQISKGWAQRLPEQVAGGVLVPHLLEVFPVRNPGIAFSLFAGFDSTLRMGLAFVSALVLLLVAWMALRRPATSSTLAGLALILGGAGGNLMDRVLFGRVTDFLLVTTGAWNGPIFNVADAAITGGAILLIWDILRTGPAIDGSGEETAACLLASHSHPPGGGPSPSPSLPGVAPLPPDCE